VNALGHPVELRLTAAQESDVTQAEGLLAGHEPDVVITDKGYDSDEVVAGVRSRGAEAVIPPRKNRVAPREIDWHLYRARAIVEWFWSKIKQYRRVATRYEKKAQNFLAFVHVTSIMVILR
jgi:transposase